MNKTLIHKIRQENLIYVIDKKCNGRQSLLAEKAKVESTYINALVKFRRHMGSETAKKIESCLHLESGFMSTAQSWSMFYTNQEKKDPLEKSKVRWLPVVDWLYLQLLLEKNFIIDLDDSDKYEKIPVENRFNAKSFFTKIPLDINIAASGDLALIEPSHDFYECKHGDYVLVVSKSGVFQFLRVHYIVDEIVLVNIDQRIAAREISIDQVDMVGKLQMIQRKLYIKTA